MPFCSVCGRYSEGNFCTYCGAPLAVVIGQPQVVQPQRAQRRRSNTGAVVAVILLMLIIGVGFLYLIMHQPGPVTTTTTGTQACAMLSQEPSVTPIFQGYITVISANIDQPTKTYAPLEQITVTGRLTQPSGTPAVNQAIHIIIIGTTQTAVVRTGSDGSFSAELFAPSTPGTYTMIVQFPGTELYADIVHEFSFRSFRVGASRPDSQISFIDRTISRPSRARAYPLTAAGLLRR